MLLLQRRIACAALQHHGGYRGARPGLLFQLAAAHIHSDWRFAQVHHPCGAFHREVQVLGVCIIAHACGHGLVAVEVSLHPIRRTGGEHYIVALCRRVGGVHSYARTPAHASADGYRLTAGKVYVRLCVGPEAQPDVVIDDRSPGDLDHVPGLRTVHPSSELGGVVLDLSACHYESVSRAVVQVDRPELVRAFRPAIGD